MTAAGGIRLKPVGGGREVISVEKRRKKGRMSSGYHREPILLLTLLGLPLHGSPLRIYPPSNRKRPPTSIRRGEGLAAAVPGRRGRERREGGGGVGGGGRRECDRQRNLSVTLH